MTDPQDQYVVSIMSRDRVGIVYEISKSISELSGNIAEIRQSVLCGYFTMILLASFPKNVNQRDIERKLAEVDAHSETAIATVVKKVENNSHEYIKPGSEYTYVLTATGADRIGFVATVASFCKDHEINILDLSTTYSGGDYIMILLIDMTRCSSIVDVRSELKQFTQDTGLKIVLQHNDIFKAVNEINLPLH